MKRSEEKIKKGFAFHPRIIRSPWANFYGKEIEDSLQTHPDDYLKEIASEGYNGIWLHAVLREIVPSKLFPDAKPDKISGLNRLVEKVGRYGIKVYLYLCEPRGFRDSDPFWEKHPELKGQPVTFTGVSDSFDGQYFALCSSTDAVREFLEESSCKLFSRVPGLGGVFMITASEMHTHCYSHFPKHLRKFTEPAMENWAKGGFSCPRCRERRPTEVTAEIIKLVNRGIKNACPSAEVIVWTWSWYILEPDPQPELISLLPKNVILMSDFERGGQKKVCGRFYPVDEYSFSSLGPSRRFKKQLKLAKKRGLRVMAKIQIGNTHELASVPYLPLPHRLAEKMERMKRVGVDGYLGCWIMGGAVSLMTKLAGRMSKSGHNHPGKMVRGLARSEFGEKSAGLVCRAWRNFSEAWSQYPFSIPVLYYSPINYAPACPLSFSNIDEPFPAAWMPLPRDRQNHLKIGGKIDIWLKPFRAGIVVIAFRRVLKKWSKGLRFLELALKNDPANRTLKEELNLARHIALSLKSVINIVRFYDSLPQTPKNREKIRKILKEELEIVAEDKKLVTFDPRLGFHSEAHTTLFTLEDLDYKMALLRRML